MALVGPSGAGKSTILNLVLRFFDPVKGKILIDGQDISQLKLNSLRAHIALVTQDPILFDDTLEANIAYGSKVIDAGKVKKAAKAAAAHDFIWRFRKAINRVLGRLAIICPAVRAAKDRYCAGLDA